MATVKKEEIVIADPMTFVTPPKPEETKEPTVSIFLPQLEDNGGGMKVDQYEHVTIANEKGEKCYKVRRGERVDVPVSVFVVMKAKYPNL